MAKKPANALEGTKWGEIEARRKAAGTPPSDLKDPLAGTKWGEVRDRRRAAGVPDGDPKDALAGTDWGKARDRNQKGEGMAKASALGMAQANVGYEPKKGHRVEIRMDGKYVPAVITKVDAQNVSVKLDDGRQGTMARLAVITGQIKPSDLPLPTKPKGFKKGDRVEFDDDNQVKVGTVVKGGARVRIILDGGKLEMLVPGEELRPTTVPLPKDVPHAMDSWGIKDYEHDARFSRGTPCFQATITLNGEPAIMAENNGNGGANRYFPLGDNTYAVIRQFEADAKQWLADAGYPEDRIFEADATWIEWKVNQAPYGMTARDLVADILGTLNQPEDDEPFSPFRK